MGTSLTPEFWERFTLVLFAAMGVTIVLAALFDSLVLRFQNRHVHRPPASPASAPHQPETEDQRMSVRS